ncbi:MAG: DUF937 domain-containing protein [Leptospira sp.]|nr:DUF937 domain-containing protein [Leptospira sp.]
MSIFDSLKAVAAQAVEMIEKNPQLIVGVTKIVEENGGVAGLVQKFKDNGFSDVASSWIGKGENTSIGADDLIKVLGKDSISQLASQVGMDTNSTAGLISSMLPVVIDKLSPDGEEPKSDVTSQLTSLASMFLK